MITKRTSIILALDVVDEKKAVAIAQSVKDEIDAIKINYPLLLNSSPSVITTLSKIKAVICDFKIADIPYINGLITKRAVELGASGVICHSFVGLDSVKSCIDAAGGADVYVVVEMSHPGGCENYGKFTIEYLQRINDLGVTGIVAPATRPERITYYRSIFEDKLILSPGVGSQGGTKKDTLDAGADFVIVGRSIYEAVDPKATVRNLE